MVEKRSRFAIITPSGDGFSWRETYKSICASDLIDIFDVVWIIVHNASSRYLGLLNPKFKIVEITLTDVACRSAARNAGLDFNKNNDGFLMFLDSGDLLNKCVELRDIQFFDDRLYSCEAEIASIAKTVRYKNNYPIKFLRNPFYLGSVILPNKLGNSKRFHPGKKEDWKYWLEILQENPVVETVDIPVYTYTIKTKFNHIGRKSKLIKEQFLFYFRFLNFNLMTSISYTLGHYLSQLTRWLLR